MFKPFPEFSKLTPVDKHKYESLVKEYPPICSISFASLMLWWNFFDSLALATLNGNLVISYWRPGEEEYAGLSIVGTNNVDESICTIFDMLRERGDVPRLVNVPEFVISSIRYPELFAFHGDRRSDEYIIPISRFYPLDKVSPYRKLRIKKALRSVASQRIVVKSVDLRSHLNQALLINAAQLWWRKGTINDFGKRERDVMYTTLSSAHALGIQNACLYVGGQLRGFCLYHTHGDHKDYVLFDHMRIDYSTPGNLDLIAHLFGQWFAEKGFTHVNIDVDLGMPRLRIQKLVLGPDNFFRKYTIEPA